MRETGLGIGYGESSTGHKQRRADAKAMEEQIDEQVDHDAVKHLELLEYMLSKYKTDHPTILPLQQTNLALTVLSGFQDFIATLKERFKGRYPNVVRQDLQAVLSVAASKCNCNELQELATLLGTSYEKLKVRKARGNKRRAREESSCRSSSRRGRCKQPLHAAVASLIEAHCEMLSLIALQDAALQPCLRPEASCQLLCWLRACDSGLSWESA